MPLLGSVDVAHVLKPEIIAHLARRDEGVGAEVAGEERQPAERNGAELCAVGGGLGQGVLLSATVRLWTVLAATRLLAGLGLRVRRPTALAVRRPLPAFAARTPRRRREIAQLVRVEAGATDGVGHGWSAAQPGLAECLVDSLGLVRSEGIGVVLRQYGLDLLDLRDCESFVTRRTVAGRRVVRLGYGWHGRGEQEDDGEKFRCIHDTNSFSRWRHPLSPCP